MRDFVSRRIERDREAFAISVRFEIEERPPKL